MANTTPAPAPTSPPLKRLTFAFPFRKKAHGATGLSADFTDEHEFYKILKDEASGTYPVSVKGMWHGGIHVTEAGAGRSLDLKYGVRCLADGEVIAYRLNRTYPVSEFPVHDGTAAISAPYSTGFALVRHSMQFPRGTTFTFYSLYRSSCRDGLGSPVTEHMQRPGSSLGCPWTLLSCASTSRQRCTRQPGSRASIRSKPV